MKKWEIYGLELLLFISMIVFNLIYKNQLFLNLSIVLIAVFFVIRFGFMKDNNYLKSMSIRIVISCILVYIITIYLLGLLTGFHRGIFSFNTYYLVQILGLGVVTVIAEEVIRYVICRNTPHQRLPIIIYSVIIALLNIILEINGYDLSDHETLFVFLTTVVLPAFCREAICSYLTYKVSYVPSVILKLFLYLYDLVLPIIPSLGNYLYAVVNVGLPYVIYYFVSKLNHYNDKQVVEQTTTVHRLFYIPTFIILILLVILISGMFSHTLVAIGSNSMVPTYGRGDAVIYQKMEFDQIKVGEILVFENNGRIITHRVVDVQKTDSSINFKTKGDANNAADTYVVESRQVLGIVRYSIKYIGFPTLWFNDLFTGKETG